MTNDSGQWTMNNEQWTMDNEHISSVCRLLSAVFCLLSSVSPLLSAVFCLLSSVSSLLSAVLFLLALLYSNLFSEISPSPPASFLHFPLPFNPKFPISPSFPANIRDSSICIQDFHLTIFSIHQLKSTIWLNNKLFRFIPA